MNKFVVCCVAVLASVCLVQAYNGIRVNKVPSFRWDQFIGKVVLVTGGSSGIGFGTALNFARFGARVIICSRDSNPAWFNGTDAANRINADPDVQSLGGYASWEKADVANVEEVDALLQNILDNEGDIDFVANNAGIAGYIGGLGDENCDQYFGGEHDSIRVNIFGQAIVLSTIVQHWMNNSRGGAIVNTASVDGLHGDMGAGLYCASKHASIGLTMSVGKELASLNPQIRVNAIAPGFVDTSLVWQQCKMIDSGLQGWEGDYITHDHPLWKKYGDSFIKASPAGKILEPIDLARMIMYLCSEEASYVTGAVMVVDAGLNTEVVETDE